MRAQWVTAALLSSVLATACGGGQTPQNTQENTPIDTTTAGGSSAPAPAEAVSPTPDIPAPAPAEPAKPARAAAPSRPSASAARPAPSSSASSVAEPAAPAPARTAPAAAPVKAPEYQTLKVAANTPLALELMTPLSSETTKVESPVRARLKQAIAIDGVTVLPTGTILNGSVTEAESSGRVKGRSRIAFAFTDATVAGAKEKLHTNPLVFEGDSTKGKDATKIGVGAGVGAVIGGILGGGSGAAKGAAIGGAAGTGAVLATKGKEVELGEGAELSATLSDPFELRVRVE